MTKYINAEDIFEIVNSQVDLYIGVPDSLLKGFLEKIDFSGKKHIICVNEAHALSIAFGVMLSGKRPCVYLQNSGLGNIINPITSLCMPSKVCPLLVIGHRHSLGQHKIMGEIDMALLDLIGYENYLLVEGPNNVK